MKLSFYKYLIMVILSIPVCLLAQSRQVFKPLSVGDTVPSISFELLNYTQSTAKLSEFKGKLIILDFWATGCSSCMALFPKMEALQRQYEGKLQIMLVNPRESTELIAARTKHYRKYKYKPGTGLSWLPAINGDKRWIELFPHNAVPHHVWIDGQGKVIAVTSGTNATAKYIEQVLRGEKVDMMIRRNLGDFDIRKSGFFNTTHQTFKPFYYSGFLPYNPDITGRSELIKRDTLAGMLKYTLINRSIIDLYTAVYKKLVPRTSFPVVLDTKNPDVYMRPKDNDALEAWELKNCFCYELSVPLDKEKEMGKLMIEDLNRFLGNLYGIKGRLENRMVKNVVLRKNSGFRISTAGGDSRSAHTDGVKEWFNTPFASITSTFYLLYQNVSVPQVFADETGFNGKVDLKLTGDLSNFENLRRQLQEYGLELVIEQREMKCLVVKDN